MATRRTAKASKMTATKSIRGPDSGTATSSLEITAADDDDDGGRPSTIEDRYRTEREQAKLRHWKESDYAAGCVEPSWADEAERHCRGEGRCGSCCQEEIDPGGCGCVYLSAVVCSRLGAGRIGNMAVLKERYVTVEVDDDEEVGEEERDGAEGRDAADGFADEEEAAPSLHQRTAGTGTGTGNATATSPDRNEGARPAAKGARRKRVVRRREIQLVVGPFWPMLLFITYPLIFVVSAVTLFKGLPGKPLYAQLGWALMTGGLVWSLFNTGFRDPGMLARHRDPPAVVDADGDLGGDDDGEGPRRRAGFRWGTEAGPWRWSDQAQTYRPRNSAFCPDCKVVVEDFDHTCPWTGTAIGKKNMGSFQCFVGLVFACLIADIFLLTVGAME